MFNVLPRWKIISKIGKMHFKTSEMQSTLEVLYADFKESVHRSHTHSDHLFWAQIRQRGDSQDCRSVVKKSVSSSSSSSS